MQRIKASIQYERSKYCPRIKIHSLRVLLVPLALILLILLPLIILKKNGGICKDFSVQSSPQIPTHLATDSHFHRNGHALPQNLARLIMNCSCVEKQETLLLHPPPVLLLLETLGHNQPS